MIEHPELRVRFVDQSEIPERDRCRRSTEPGSYEWWRFEAIDPDTRSGCAVSFHSGCALSPQYRRQLIRRNEGLSFDQAQLDPAAHVVVSMVVFRDGKAWRRSDLHYPASSLTVRENPWQMRIGPCTVAMDESGWHVSARGTPWSLGLGGPQLHPDEEIIIELTLTPNLATPTLERAFLPTARTFATTTIAGRDVLGVAETLESATDSAAEAAALEAEQAEQAEQETAAPSDLDVDAAPEDDAQKTGNGDAEAQSPTASRSPGKHNWLLACPSGRVSGMVRVNSKKGEHTFDLRAASGFHDHVWGTGMLGEGFYRRYATRCNWPEGAVVCDLPMYAKNVQVAATFMLFDQSGPPRIFRGDRVRLSGMQLSTWLLSHPGEMRWREVKGAVTLHQETIFPFESNAFCMRSLATVDVSYPGRRPEEDSAASAVGSRSVRGIGVTQVDQFNRLDMPGLSRLLERCLFGSPSSTSDNAT